MPPDADPRGSHDPGSPWVSDAESMRRIGDDAGNVCEDLLGISMTDGGYGWATADMVVPADVSQQDPLPPHLLGTLADVSVGRSVLTTIAPPGGCRTAQLHLDFTAVPVLAPQTLTARGEVVRRAEGMGLSTATIWDAEGHVLLRASGWLAIVESAEEAAASQANRPRPAAASQRELSELIRTRSDSDGGRQVHTIPQMANRFGIMHGGMQLTLLMAALTDTATEQADHPQLLSVDAVLHRPAPVGHVPLAVSSQVVRVGRRVLTISGELLGPNRKAVLTGTALFAR